MNDFLTSTIRTVVPMLAGWLVVQALKVGIELNPGDIEGLVYPVIMGAYYAAARALEKKWPALGWLLGVPRVPTYS